MLTRLTFAAVLLTAGMLIPVTLHAEETEPVRVLILGTYHFANPGRDLNNMEADNVLSGKRQAELEALASSLAAFRPTAIAVEREAEPPYDDPGFAAFDDAMLAEKANETVQIGYRLAAVAGVSRVYAIDEQPAGGEPDYFPYGEVMEFAESTGRAADLAAISDYSAVMGDFEAMQETASIPQLLAFMNGDRFSDSFYWSIIEFGEGEDQPGAELAAYWFMRNAKIFNKLTQIAEPGDRVVVIYGAGHNAWLRELVEKTPGYELEPVLPYLTGE